MSHNHDGEHVHTAIDHSLTRYKMALPAEYEGEEVRWTTTVMFNTPYSLDAITYDNESGATIFVYAVLDDNAFPMLSEDQLHKICQVGPHKDATHPDDEGLDLDSVPDEIRMLIEMAREMGMDDPPFMADMRGMRIGRYMKDMLETAGEESGFADSCSLLAFIEIPIPVSLVNVQFLDDVKAELAVGQMISEDIDINLN